MLSRSWFGSAVLLLVAMSSVSAQSARLTPELVMSLRVVSDVALSPDGQSILYRTDRPRAGDEGLGASVGELWRVSADGGSSRRIAEATFNARQPTWSPEGRRFAWIAQADARSPGQLFIGESDGLPAALTNAPGGVEALRWSPDGNRIAYTAWDAASPGEVEQQRAGRDWTVLGMAPKQLRLYIVDIRTRQSTLITREDLTIHYFSWSPDGKRFAVAAAPTPEEDDRALRTQAYVISADGGSVQKIAATVGKLTDPVWSGDGKWIAWLGSTALTDPAAGSVFVASTNGGSARNLTAGFAGTATTLSALPGTSSTFVFRSEEWQATTLRRVDAVSGEIGVLSAPKQIFGGAPSFSADGRGYAVAGSAADHPNEVFVGSNIATGPRRVTHSNPQLAAVELGTQDIARWRSKDGLPIEGVLIKPPGFKQGTRLPVVLHIHGGSESVVPNGWQGSFNNWGQLLAARGYLVLYPNYRGSRGRGVEFVAGNRRDIMGREWEDIESGLDHLIASGIADGERAGIYGFSWGGYAAGWGATFASHRFKAAVGGAGIYNWISEAGTTETRMHEQLSHWDAPLYEHFSMYLERSPIYHIRKANTPVLLLHGQEDPSCPLGQAIEFHTALKWKGVPVELVIYPREGHGMDEHEHRLDFATRGLNWFDRYLKPE